MFEYSWKIYTYSIPSLQFQYYCVTEHNVKFKLQYYKIVLFNPVSHLVGGNCTSITFSFYKVLLLTLSFYAKFKLGMTTLWKLMVWKKVQNNMKWQQHTNYYNFPLCWSQYQYHWCQCLENPSVLQMQEKDHDNMQSISVLAAKYHHQFNEELQVFLLELNILLLMLLDKKLLVFMYKLSILESVAQQEISKSNQESSEYNYYSQRRYSFISFSSASIMQQLTVYYLIKLKERFVPELF